MNFCIFTSLTRLSPLLFYDECWIFEEWTRGEGEREKRQRGGEAERERDRERARCCRTTFASPSLPLDSVAVGIWREDPFGWWLIPDVLFFLIDDVIAISPGARLWRTDRLRLAENNAELDTRLVGPTNVSRLTLRPCWWRIWRQKRQKTFRAASSRYVPSSPWAINLKPSWERAYELPLTLNLKLAHASFALMVESESCRLNLFH